MFGINKQSLPIGVDLGHDSIKITQLERFENGVRILGNVRETLSDETRLSPDQRLENSLGLVRRVIARRPFVGRRVVACLPREMVQLKNLRLPVMPAEELSAAVAFEAANVLGLDASSAMIRHVVAGEIKQGGESRMEVICMAARHEHVDGFVEAFHRAGLDLCGLDFEPAALFRGVHRLLPAATATSASVLLDVGYRRTQVMIGRGEHIQFFKPIDIGSRRLIAAVARKLSITENEAAALRAQIDTASVNSPIDSNVIQAVEDATRQAFSELVREVALCLRYFSVTFRGVRVRHLRIVGGEAKCSLLRKMLSHEIAIPLEASPLIGVADAAKSAVDVSPFCLAAALSLRSFAPSATPVSALALESWEAAAGGAEVEVLND